MGLRLLGEQDGDETFVLDVFEQALRTRAARTGRVVRRRRLRESIRNIPPAETEERWWARQEQTAIAA